MVGNGLSDLRVFCGIMDLPPPVNPSAFNKLQTTLLQTATDEAGASMRKAVEEELILSEASKKEDTQERRQGGEEETDDETEVERDELMEEDNNPRPLEVSGDGTWQGRGYKSLNGAVLIIGTGTAKILDHEVLTSYCQACTEWT